MPDKYEFMEIVAKQFEGLKTEKEINDRTLKMINIIFDSAKLAKGYLKAGIL